MIHFNLGSHNPDLSRNHKVIDELTSLVEQVCDSTSTEVSTERAAFTTKPRQERCQVSCYNGDITRQNDLICGRDVYADTDYCLEHQDYESEMA